MQNVVPLVWTGQGELILEATLHNAGNSSGFNIFFKREGGEKKKRKEKKKKLLQHEVFVVGHPSKY